MIYEQQGLWGETDLEFAERTAIELIKTFKWCCNKIAEQRDDVENGE